MGGRLTVHAFGDLIFTDDGQVTTLESRRELALAFYLIYTGQTCSRSALADLIWPDSTPSQARTNLRHVLSSFRNSLPGLMIINRDYVQLDPDRPVWLDVHEFEACVFSLDPPAIKLLEQAVELYRGDFLAHFNIDSQPFQDWVLLEQERLRLLAIEALDALVRHHEAAGDYATALRYASRLCQMDELRELSQRHLMRLLYKSGNRSAALAQYETCSQLLQAELGVQPEAETQTLYHKIQGDGTLAASLEQTRPAAPQLPARRRAFIGRRVEVEKLMQRLTTDSHCRLLTLTGIGGVGKTRLALEIAHQAVPNFRDGVYWVDLTAIQSLDAGLNALASALCLQFQLGALSPEDQLLAYVQDRHLLLVLDNYEHLIGVLTPLLGRLLNQAADIRVLVTSRQALNVDWEWLHQVEGLAVPRDWREADAAGYDAVQLFAHRARRVRRDLEVPAHLECIVHICRQVSGLPLGIELAAGWLRVMYCDEIARELTGLENPVQDVPARHRSLGALVEDIWQRLPPDEQHSLARLSVFEGGFQREAAAAVAGASVAMLAALVNRSLLQVDHQTGRYGIHLVLKDFAAARLTEDGQVQHQIRSKHCAYYSAWLHELEARLQGPQREATLDQIEDEIDNIRAAWAWAIDHHAAEALGYAVESLSAFYEVRTWYHEAIQAFRRAADAVQALPETPELILLQINLLLKLVTRLCVIEGYSSPDVGAVCQRARALCARAKQTPNLVGVLHFLGTYYATCAEWAAAEKVMKQVLLLTEQTADQDLLIAAHHNFEFLYLFMGQFEKSLFYTDYILERYDPKRHHMAIRLTNSDPGLIALSRSVMSLWFLGYPEQALARARRVIPMAERLQHAHSTAFAYAFLMPVLRWCGEWESHDECARRSLVVCQENDLGYFLGLALVYRALTLMQTGDLDEAIIELRDAIEVWRSSGAEGIVPVYLSYLAEAHWRAGQFEAGLGVIDDGLERIARTGEGMSEAESNRIKGELLLAQGNIADAEASFERAIAVSQTQHARSLELRAVMSLARLWQRKGRTAGVRARLQIVYDWFTEGFGTPDLQEARALLGELDTA
jgi:predicted ATPase/DNA-binding SARP family transcriptional activator